ncbi:Ni/Co efflux regulator RcnB [Paraburkholderia sp. GAS41]|jgi:Ni/Co efflux regulator RcnB
MKSLIYAVAAVAVFAAPVVSFAQSNEPVTRAQVQAELSALEQVGYDPARGEDVHYPDDIQAALMRLAAHASN